VNDGLFGVFALNECLDQRGMREGTLGIVNVGIGVVVEQYDRLVLGNNADGCYQLLELIL